MQKMKKLWQKSWTLDKTIELFETRGDLVLDQLLVKYDVWGSLAQAAGLAKIGILTEAELKQAKLGLKQILKLNEQGKFKLEMGDEDVHTKIENYLTVKYGEVGKKIHTGRSRNDQVLTAIRLFTKDNLLAIWGDTLQLIEVLLDFGQKYQLTLMPGYTHMQQAMPSSVGMWALAIAEGLMDDLVLLNAAYELTDQSPLGSAASYGVPLPLDREYTAKLMGFSKVQINSLYSQNSRGKIEAATLAALTSLLTSINKFASDVLLFTTSEFGFFEVARELCSGSSIMPQKKNVDVAELLRSKVHVLLANYVQVLGMATNLVSGYNRDLQDSKKPLFESLDLVDECLKVTTILVQNLTPKPEVMQQALVPQIFATHKAFALVDQGVAFREAYQQAGAQLDQIQRSDMQSLVKLSKHLGGLGNLGIKELQSYLKKLTEQFEKKRQLFTTAIAKLTD